VKIIKRTSISKRLTGTEIYSAAFFQDQISDDTPANVASLTAVRTTKDTGKEQVKFAFWLSGTVFGDNPCPNLLFRKLTLRPSETEFAHQYCIIGVATRSGPGCGWRKG
jgi:hypothetical protein